MKHWPTFLAAQIMCIRECLLEGKSQAEIKQLFGLEKIQSTLLSHTAFGMGQQKMPTPKKEIQILTGSGEPFMTFGGITEYRDWIQKMKLHRSSELPNSWLRPVEKHTFYTEIL